MKAKTVQNTNQEIGMWCEACCIRIAPNEERTAIHGKPYHLRCYAKLRTKPKGADQATST